MMRSHIQRGLLAVALCSSPLAASQIDWFSAFGATNLASDDSPMDAGYRFELGVFEGSFVPTPANKAQWAANWRPAQGVGYNATTQSFDGVFTVENNDPPFIIGKPAYVWGWRLVGNESEWILFRGAGWTWPEHDPFPLFPVVWEASDATAVIGGIGGPGDPFLMKSADATITWPQWRAEFLAGELLDGPNDDPDLDGTPNLIEFVFGTDPMVVTPPPRMPVNLVEQGGERFLQITIPRRIDHRVILVAEVSGDLAVWNSGPAHTSIVANDLQGLVIRDLVPWSPSAPRRFMRLKATLP